MKKVFILGILILLSCVPIKVQASVMKDTSCLIDQILGSPQPEDKKDTMFQISTFDAYKNGYYKNIENAISAKKKFGNFGVGLLKDDAGAILLIQNKNYKVKDFQISEVGKIEYTPIAFGIFKYFETDDKISMKNISSYNELIKKIDNKLDTVNYFVAILGKGNFNKLVLTDYKNQDTTLTTIKGTIIGYRIPSFYGTTAPIGYSLYFVSEDGKTGGKIKDINVNVISLGVDYTNRIELILPKDKSFKVKDFAQYQPQSSQKILENKKVTQKDMQKIMNSSKSIEPNPDEMMQMMTPRMNF